MKVEKRKKSKTDYSNYSMYCFRASKEQKTWINNQLKAMKIKLNKNKQPDDKVIKLNDIIIEALRLGIPLVKREGK